MIKARVSKNFTKQNMNIATRYFNTTLRLVFIS